MSKLKARKESEGSGISLTDTPPSRNSTRGNLTSLWLVAVKNGAFDVAKTIERERSEK